MTTLAHIHDDALWRLAEEAERYESHARCCQANANATKDGLLAQMNRERAKRWMARAQEVRIRIDELKRKRGIA
jgi:hypothetical protein